MRGFVRDVRTERPKRRLRIVTLWSARLRAIVIGTKCLLYRRARSVADAEMGPSSAELLCALHGWALPWFVSHQCVTVMFVTLLTEL